MSQHAQPTVPPTVDPSQRKPTSIVVFGVLNIVFGALGCIMAPLGLIQFFADPQSNPIYEHVQGIGWYMAYSMVSAVLGIVLALALLAAGIGLLMDKPWGRLVSIGVAAANLVLLLIAIPVTLMVMLPLTTADDPAVQAGGYAGIASGSCGMCIGMIYPILLIVFMMRPAVKTWFAKQAGDELAPMA